MYCWPACMQVWSRKLPHLSSLGVKSCETLSHCMGNLTAAWTGAKVNFWTNANASTSPWQQEDSEDSETDGEEEDGSQSSTNQQSASHFDRWGSTFDPAHPPVSVTHECVSVLVCARCLVKNFPLLSCTWSHSVRSFVVASVHRYYCASDFRLCVRLMTWVKYLCLHPCKMNENKWVCISLSLSLSVDAISGACVLFKS